MKTIFKIISLVIIISFTSCDRPLEPTDYLNDRAPLVAFQGNKDVIFVSEGGENSFEIFVGVSTLLNDSITYIISNDETSVITEGNGFEFEGNYTIPSGEFTNSFKVNFDWSTLPAGPSQLFFNLSTEGSVITGGNNQFDLTVVKI